MLTTLKAPKVYMYPCYLTLSLLLPCRFRKPKILVQLQKSVAESSSLARLWVVPAAAASQWERKTPRGIVNLRGSAAALRLPKVKRSWQPVRHSIRTGHGSAAAIITDSLTVAKEQMDPWSNPRSCSTLYQASRTTFGAAF